MTVAARNTAQVSYLLNVRQGLREDLAEAASVDEANEYRAALAGVDHSLRLAGHRQSMTYCNGCGQWCDYDPVADDANWVECPDCRSRSDRAVATTLAALAFLAVLGVLVAVAATASVLALIERWA